MKEVFMECDTCRAKTGAPILCDGCYHNRTLINNLLAQRREARALLAVVDIDQPDFPQSINKVKRTLTRLEP